MGRYLIFFSYVGTSYRGMQINNRKVGELLPAVKTVQGVLEECIKKLKPANEVKIKTSSRTDSSVHALCNSVHLDLVHRNHPLEFDPKIITSCLNRNLRKMNENIRILNTLHVTDDFSARRRVIERSYVYRLAVIKNLALFPGTPQTALECDRSHCIYTPFDLEKFLKAAEVLSGKHNFLSFTTKKATLEPDFNETKPIKNISIHVQRGSSYMEEHQDCVQGHFEFWEVHFQTRSFLNKQIRRMMGGMLAVAQGRLTLKDLQLFLDIPSLDNTGRINTLPAQGLFLKWVRYSKEDLHYEPPEISAVQEQVPDLAVEEEQQIETTQISSASVTSDAFRVPALGTNIATETFTEKTASECVDIQARAGQESTILNLKDLPKTAEIENCSELLETSTTIATPTTLRHANDISSTSDLDVHKLAAPIPVKSVECNDFCEIEESSNNLENFKESKI